MNNYQEENFMRIHTNSCSFSGLLPSCFLGITSIAEKSSGDLCLGCKKISKYIFGGQQRFGFLGGTIISEHISGD